MCANPEFFKSQLVTKCTKEIAGRTQARRRMCANSEILKSQLVTTFIKEAVELTFHSFPSLGSQLVSEFTRENGCTSDI